jgi:hypothetical protein
LYVALCEGKDVATLALESGLIGLWRMKIFNRAVAGCAFAVWPRNAIGTAATRGVRSVELLRTYGINNNERNLNGKLVRLIGRMSPAGRTRGNGVFVAEASA